MLPNIGQFLKSSCLYVSNDEKISCKKIYDFFESIANIVRPIFFNLHAMAMSYTRSLADYIWVPRTASSSHQEGDMDIIAELNEDLDEEIENQRKVALKAKPENLNVDGITSTISTISAFVLPPMCALLSVDPTMYKSVFTPLSLMTALPNTNKTSILSRALGMNVPVSSTEQILYTGAVLSVAKVIVVVAGTTAIGTAMPTVSAITAIAALPPIRNAVIKTERFQAVTKTTDAILGNANEYVVSNLAHQIQKHKLVSKSYPTVLSGFSHMLTAVGGSEVNEFQNTAIEMLASARSVINESTGNAAVKSTLSQGGLGRAAIGHFIIQPTAIQVVNFETAASRMLAQILVSGVVSVGKSVVRDRVIGNAMVALAVSHPVIATAGFVLAGGKMTALNFFTRVAAAGVLWKTKSPLAASSVILVVDGMKLYIDLRRTARANLEKANAKAKANEEAKIKANQGKVKSSIKILSTKHVTAGAFDNALAFISSASTSKLAKVDNPKKTALKNNTLAMAEKAKQLAMAEKAKQKTTIQANQAKVATSIKILSPKHVTARTFAHASAFASLASTPKATKVMKQNSISISGGQLQHSTTFPMPILEDGALKRTALNTFYRGKF